MTNTTINKFPTQEIHLCTYHYQNNQYQTTTLLAKYEKQQLLNKKHK